MKRKLLPLYALLGLLVASSCSKETLILPEEDLPVIVRSADEPASDPADWELAEEAVVNMGVGWNLGNTLDPTGSWIKQYTANRPQDYETAWGQPVTKAAMFGTFKEAGFGFIRVPVSWGEKMDKNYVVSKAWMDRVQTVVDYVLDAGMYCIINVHHDTGTDGWLKADPSKYEANSAKFKKLWEQIAERFADYDYHLLFEGFNEILDAGNHWSDTDSESYKIVNKLNQDFVNIIRASSSENNRHRNLICTTYSASCTDGALKAFAIPTDSVCTGRLMAQFHLYSPYNFALNEETDADGNPPKKYQYAEFLYEYQEEISDRIYACYKRFTKKHIPCIMGEFGAFDKNNEAERAKHAEYNTRWAARYGIAACYWMGLMDGKDRTDCKWTAPLVKDAIIKAYQQYAPDPHPATAVRPIYE